MLARASLSDHAALAHPFSQQSLAQRIIDLVRARMRQVFALEVDLRAAQVFGQVAGKGQRRWPAHIGVQQIIQFGLEPFIGTGFMIGSFQLGDGGH